VRILYHAINGSGLGHLTRLASIALAVQQEAPDVHQLMATSANYPPLLQSLCMPSVILPHDDDAPFTGMDRRLRTVSARLARRILSDTVRAYDPKILVFDTHAPWGVVDEAWKDGRRPVLVLRHCRDEVLAKMLRESVLSCFSLVVVPHTREQLAAIVSTGVLRQLDNLPVIRYVGGIAFPSAINTDAVRNVGVRYGIAETERLILICAGSGGYGAINRRFIEKACRAAIERRKRDPSVHVVYVPGPYADPGWVSPDCMVIRDEPELPSLMARAELVVAHAGYNTVHEVLQAGCRALLVPMPRGAEDQAAFVASLLPRPGVRALSPDASEAAFGRAMRHLLQEPRPQPIAAVGARLAARAILELGGLPDVYICTRAPLSTPAPGRRLRPRHLVRSLETGLSQVRLCLDWDVANEVLGGIGPEARSRIVSIEVHLGSSSVDEWEYRVHHVCALMRTTELDLQTLSFCVDDIAAQLAIAELSERIGDLRFRALVAHVPLDTLRAQPDTVFKAVERCRALRLGFGIDITILENPLPYVDQP
jgi:predicted glycosyltransferase